MTVLIAWLVVAAIFFMALFVVKRLLGLIFRRNKANRSRANQESDLDHEEIGEAAEDIAKAARVAAGLAAAGAYVAAPTGLSAIGATIGLVSVPIIVTIAPALVAVAFGTAAFSAAVHLYFKHRRKTRK